jgi:integrase
MDTFSTYLLKCMNAEFCDNPKHHIKTVVVFAVVFSGLACLEQLEAFYNDLCAQKLKLSEKAGELSCELKYTKKGHPGNLLINDGEDSDEIFSYSPQCLDSLTSLVLLGFVKRRNLNKEKLPTFDEILKQIHLDLYKETRSHFSKQNLIQQLFVCGQMMTHASTPEFLFQFATGSTFSGGSESDSLHYKQKTEKRTNKSADKKLHQHADLSLAKRLTNVCVSNTTLDSDNAFINKILNICDTETLHFNRNRTIEKVKSLINSEDPRSIPAEILGQWIHSGLGDKFKNGSYRWGEGKGTPVVYLKMIQDDWLEQFKELDITEIADGESEEIYWALVHQNVENNSNYIKTLPLLYKFIAHHYPDAIESPELILDEDGVNFVRSRLITEDMFQRCINKLLEYHCNKDSHFKRALELLVTIIFRLGLRPKEAFNLKLENISFGEVCEVEIHRNKESGKSASADRRIRASLFLKQDELEHFKQLYDARIFQTGNNINALLFSKCISTDKKFDYHNVNTPAADYLSEIAGYRTVFYQCRHTFITNLVVICFASSKIATEMTCYELTQIEQIKKKFYVNPSTILDQISNFVGHLSPSTTLISYAHRVDLCLINYLENGYHGISFKALSKLMNIRQSYLKRKVNIEGLNAKGDEQKLITHVRTELNKYIRISTISSQERQPLDRVNKEHWNPLKPTIKLAIEIGRHLSQSMDEKTIAEGLAVDIKFCKCIRVSILKLKEAGFIATHNEAEKDSVDSSANKITIPNIKPVTYEETLEVANTLLTIKPHLENYDAISKKFLMSSVTKGYVLFSNIDELVTTLKSLKDAVPLQRWKVIYETVYNERPSNNIDKSWKLLPKSNLVPSEHKVHDTEKYPDGRFYLHHRHVNEGRYNMFKKNQKVYSDNVVRVAFYWAEVFSRSKEMLKTISDENELPHISLTIERLRRRLTKSGKSSSLKTKF